MFFKDCLSGILLIPFAVAVSEYMKSFNMPTTLKEIGIEPSKENVDKIKQYLLDSPYIEDREDNVTKLDEALKTILN